MEKFCEDVGVEPENVRDAVCVVTRTLMFYVFRVAKVNRPLIMLGFVDMSISQAPDRLS